MKRNLVEDNKSGLRRSPRKTKVPDTDKQASVGNDTTEATRRNRFQRPKPNGSSRNRVSSPSFESPPSSPASSTMDSRSPSASGPQLTLKDRSLWAKFNAIDNEMILTQTGRAIFPYLRFRASNLDPDSIYAIAFQIEQMDTKKYRYVNKEWQVDDKLINGPAAVYDPHWYYHPDSYSTGKTLMNDIISFQSIRISNRTPNSKTSKSSNSHLFLLTSFRRYRPRIRLLQFSQHDRVKTIGSWSFMFDETSFFAVTHYQNRAVNRLKTDHNPHAKAFRTNTENLKNKRKCKVTNKELDTSKTDTRRAPARKKSRKASPKRTGRAKTSRAAGRRVARRNRSETEEEQGDDEDTEEEIRENTEYFYGRGDTDESDESDTDYEEPSMATRVSRTRYIDNAITSHASAPKASRRPISSERAGHMTGSRNLPKRSVQPPQDMTSEDGEDENDESALVMASRSSAECLKTRLMSVSDEDLPSSDTPPDMSSSPTLSPCPSHLADSLESDTGDSSGEGSRDVEEDDLSDDSYWHDKKGQRTSSSTVQPRTAGDDRTYSSNRAQAKIRIGVRTEDSYENISKMPPTRHRNFEYPTEHYGDYGQYHAGYSSWNGYGSASSMAFPYAHTIEGNDYTRVYTSTDNSSLSLKRRRRGESVPEVNILCEASWMYEQDDMISRVLLPVPVPVPIGAMPTILQPNSESILCAPSMEPGHFQGIEPVPGVMPLAKSVHPPSPQPPSPPHASATWYQQFFVWDQPSPPVPNDSLPELSTAQPVPVSASTPDQPPHIAWLAAPIKAHHGQRATQTNDTETSSAKPAFPDALSDVTSVIVGEPRASLTTVPALTPFIPQDPHGSGSWLKETHDGRLYDELDGLQETRENISLRDPHEGTCQSEVNHARQMNNGLTETLCDDNKFHLRRLSQTLETVTERH
ncbi:T-box transcription factor tbx22, partial [Haplosporangium bisporale]